MLTKEKKRVILLPHYMQKFSCIGSQCEDTCCVGWRVDVDRQTYKKYRQVKHESLAPLFKKKVTRNRSTPSDARYAKIKMEKGNRCSFLSEENLCTIQLHLGEEYLSTTCATYPRVSNLINDSLEKSATMSCPEAARLALLNPEPMEFDYIEEPYNVKQATKGRIKTTDPLSLPSVEHYFWELRIFSIQVLQNRSLSLEERLIILGLFYQKVQEVIDQGQPQEILALIGTYTNRIANQEFQQYLQAIPSQLSIQIQFLKALAEIRFSQGINSQRYLQCLAQFLQGIHYSKESNMEEITQHYGEAFHSYYQPFMAEHEYILENYLVNYVYKNLFPLSGEKRVFDNYVALILHYSLIKMHLIGMAGYHKELNTDMIIKLIQSFAKTVEHNSAYIKRIVKIVKENQYASMAYMAILIKN